LSLNLHDALNFFYAEYLGPISEIKLHFISRNPLVRNDLTIFYTSPSAVSRFLEGHIFGVLEKLGEGILSWITSLRVIANTITTTIKIN
jgi:hypothetical protein